jgi:hypothetical protein
MRAVHALALSIFVSITSPVLAKPYVLKCTTAEGYPRIDVTIDIEHKTITWGNAYYTISDITDEYVTGIHTPRDYYGLHPPDLVGGEVFVLDRVSGVYKRAWVGLACKDPPPHCEGGSTVLRAITTEGTCTRPMF